MTLSQYYIMNLWRFIFWKHCIVLDFSLLAAGRFPLSTMQGFNVIILRPVSSWVKHDCDYEDIFPNHNLSSLCSLYFVTITATLSTSNPWVQHFIDCFISYWYIVFRLFEVKHCVSKPHDLQLEWTMSC